MFRRILARELTQRVQAHRCGGPEFTPNIARSVRIANGESTTRSRRKTLSDVYKPLILRPYIIDSQETHPASDAYWPPGHRLNPSARIRSRQLFASALDQPYGSFQVRLLAVPIAVFRLVQARMMPSWEATYFLTFALCCNKSFLTAST